MGHGELDVGLAAHARAPLVGDQARLEEHLHARLAAEFVECGLQRLSGDGDRSVVFGTGHRGRAKNCADGRADQQARTCVPSRMTHGFPP